MLRRIASYLVEGPFLGYAINRYLHRRQWTYFELKKIIPNHRCLQDIYVYQIKDRQTERYLLIKNIVNFIFYCVEKNNSICVIYINDLHWSDEGTIEVIDLMLGQLSQNRQNQLYLFLFL